MRNYTCRIFFTDTPEEKKLIQKSWANAAVLDKEFKEQLATEMLSKSIHFWLWISFFVETVRSTLAVLYNYYLTGGWTFSMRARVFLSLYWWIWAFTVVLLVLGFSIRKHPEKYTSLIIMMGDLYILTYLVRGVGLAAMEVETGIVGFSMIIALFVSGFVLDMRPVIAISNMTLTVASFIGTAIAMRLTPLANPVVVFSLLCVSGFSLLTSLAKYHTRYKAFLKEKSLQEASVALHLLNARLEEKKAEVQQQNEELQVMSRTDRLTGLRNRHCFVEDSEKIVERAKESKTFVTLAIADLDGFKYINDNYGHTVGDECLRAVGEILQLLEEENVTTYRFGGDEFITLFDGKSRSDAFLLMNRFLKDLSNVHIEGYDGMPSSSIGIYSAIPAADSNVDEFIEKADKAMYKAKNSGKNRIEMNYTT